MNRRIARYWALALAVWALPFDLTHCAFARLTSDSDDASGACLTLSSATASGVSLSYSSLGAQSFNFDIQDQIDNDGVTNTASTYFDANGNATNYPAPAQYDWANRLTNYNNGTVVITYDSDGNRIKKTAGGVTTLYLVSTVNPTGYAQVVEESTVSGGRTNLSKVYSYGLDLVAQRVVSGGAVSYFGYDGLGSVKFLTGSTGSVTDTYIYDAFGNLITASGITSNNYRYTGEQWDPDLAFYYLRARYMNPAIGRFQSADTFQGEQADPLSLHRYLYVGNQPPNVYDPSGYFGEVLGELMIDMSQRVTVWAASGSTAAKGLGIALATLNVIAFASDPATYIAFGPTGAPEIIGADVMMLLRAGGGLFQATRSAAAARNAFKILSGWRADMSFPRVGQPGGDSLTTAVLEIHDSIWVGTRFQGRSPMEPKQLSPLLNPNAITRTHAEADVFNQAAWAGAGADRATLTVDRELCKPCGKNGGVKSMARALGIRELTVVTPSGKQVIVIDSSVNQPSTVPTPYGLIDGILTQ